MLPKTVAAICTAISFLILSCSLSKTDTVSDDLNIRLWPAVSEKTWYQEGAFLQVIDGNFTVQLLADDSAPKFLNAERRSILRVNRGFATIPSVESLSLEENSISEIGSSVFEGLPQLVHLSLAQNRITWIPEDGFKGLTKLKVLNLDGNLLSYTRQSFSIANDILPSLTHLYMQRCTRLTTFDLTKNNFICNSNLEHLYLTNSSLTTFDLRSSQDMVCLPNLTHLYLDGNKLSTLFLGEAPALRALSLERNSFRAVPTLNSELKFLSMANNAVADLKNVENAKNLVRLILTSNSLGNMLQFNGQFQNFTFLEHIALNSNSLPYLPDGCFHNLPSLRSLYLHNNKISYIYPKAFAKLPALKALSFRSNILTSFPGSESFGESNLTFLDLANNKVVSVGDLQANMIPELKVLDLTGNPLKRVEPLSVSSETIILL